MNVGCCVKCKYLDLIENVPSKCPRCGAGFVSLGIESSLWNSMSEEERQSTLEKRFPKPDPALWSELWPDPETEGDAGAEEHPREYVFICYKCNTVTAHPDEKAGYYCPECGSDMVSSGYDTVEWAYLSKEEKRKVTEDSKIRYMVGQIKNTSYDDSETVSRVIKVVKNTDQ